ncbi:MAG: hypothetical protein JRC90_03295 [Deltaproteobacteria bacterium]|nr:hypothetical protein [Deltaproteobacteria bacterium]
MPKLRIYSANIKAIRKIITVICVFLILSSFGCTGLHSGSYGKITPDRNVTQAFETFQVNPDFNYYISGPDVYPHVIIGINKNHTLKSELWKKREFTPETLKNLVEDMKFRVMEFYETPHGFDILDNDGNDIGDWYSIFSATTIVKIEEDHSVIIITPDIDTYEKYEIEREDE